MRFRKQANEKFKMLRSPSEGAGIRQQGLKLAYYGFGKYDGDHRYPADWRE
jgi:hypothetical protein